MAQSANARPLAPPAVGCAEGLHAPLSWSHGALEAACFEAHPDAQFVLDPACTIVAANRAARQLIEEQQGPRVLAERLVANGAETLRLLAERVERTIRTQEPSAETTLSLSPMLEFVARILPLGPELGRALMIVRRREAPAQLARERFQFTPAESYVALCLADGLTVAEIAERRGISIETVRCHLKQAFVKAGVHRQAELVAVMLGR
jgi:DNA-binding CsgD family transcriptional regulator